MKPSDGYAACLLLCCLLLAQGLQAQTDEFSRRAKRNYRTHPAKDVSLKETEEQLLPERDSLVYADCTWYVGNALLSDGRKLSALPMRYDLERDQLEVRWVRPARADSLKADTLLRTLPMRQLQEFAYMRVLPDGGQQPVRFVNGLRFRTQEGVPAVGMFEQWVDGPFQLWAETVLLMYATSRPIAPMPIDLQTRRQRMDPAAQGSPYNPAVTAPQQGVSGKRYRYLLVSPEGAAHALPGSRKELFALFPEQLQEELLLFSRTQPDSWDSPEGLRQLVRYANSKLTP